MVRRIAKRKGNHVCPGIQLADAWNIIVCHDPVQPVLLTNGLRKASVVIVRKMIEVKLSPFDVIKRRISVEKCRLTVGVIVDCRDEMLSVQLKHSDAVGEAAYLPHTGG